MRNDDLLRQYLLGELSDEDTALLEARLIQDEDLFERAEAVEADLLEEHAHGGLSAVQRARIRRHLASSAAARSQLAVVQALGRMAEQEKPERRVLTGPWGRTALTLPWVRGLAAAAMLAIAVGSVWMARVTVPLPEEAEQVAEVTPAPAAPPVLTPTPAVETPVPDQVAQVEPTPEPVPAATPAPPPIPTPFAFTLALTAFRGPEDVTKELRIPAGTEQITIHLPLSPGDEASPSFQVVLRDDAGTELIRRTDLLPVKIGESSDLVLPVEAKLLRPGRYSVEVYGEGDDALGFPEFQVLEP
ncbi:MAG: hypothetical protein QOH06_3266 [Acidobacteriota bacterium]|jgi:cell division septation protein DedD|nr:hypothetical protein [Acidobacteriota bacterium]